MSDFWYNAPTLALLAIGGFVLWGLGNLILNDMETEQVRYEQCIAANKQWIKGSCVK